MIKAPIIAVYLSQQLLQFGITQTESKVGRLLLSFKINTRSSVFCLWFTAA